MSVEQIFTWEEKITINFKNMITKTLNKWKNIIKEFFEILKQISITFIIILNINIFFQVNISFVPVT